MSSEFSIQRRMRLFVLLGVLFCLSFSTVPAEDNIDAAPVIISEGNSTRALTAAPRTRGIVTPTHVFSPGAKTRITVYITGIDLLEGEGASAFRADATDGQYRRYPLQIISLAPTPERPWVYALTFRLHAGMGDVGDVLLRVTWRGMASNRVRLSIGHEGGGLKDDEGAVPTPLPDSPLVSAVQSRASLPYTGDRVRFMHQATFGPTPALESQLRRLGYSAWLAQQMEQKRDANNALRYSTFPMPALALRPDMDPTCTTADCIRDNFSMYPLQTWFFREAIYGEDQQLRRRVSWALHQIFVVSGRETIQPSRMTPYITVLDKNAFGNFRNLLMDITLNPAMGNYLDMATSTRQNPNENYAREILQLFSIGLDMLNQDGTPKLDSEGNRIPSYTQDTVNNFTKVFTGWRLCSTPANCPGSVSGARNFKDPMELIPANHDTTQKNLLVYPGSNFSVLPAGQDAEIDLQQAIENIFYHPNVAPFISKLLIQQLVTSNPTPAYVKRVADVFSDELGGGLDRGNLGKVVRAILLDPEARGNVKTDPDYGHLREPVLYATNILRPLSPTAQANAIVAANCNGQVDGINNVTSILDQDVFNPPSVFNYYSMEYSIPNTNLAAPEFAIMTTGTALKRPNFIHQMIGPGNATPTGAPNGATGIVVNNNLNVRCGARVNLTKYQNLAASDPTGVLLVDTINREFLNGSMNPNVKTQILNAITPIASTNPLKRAQTALYLVFTSSQFQVQR
jgi:uncharacterized protein (DUF1800 family)